jgi:phospholipid/cholesterol/gamma-HCH transport system substrate-binding protein
MQFKKTFNYRIRLNRDMIKKMSRNTPWLYYSVVFSAVLFLISLWFFLHPNSPWHSRNHYVIAFKEIGDLKVGNTVNVNGLPKGYVEKLELTDSCVWTKIAVLSTVKIPRDSRLHLANVGLMGERIIEITLGNAKRYYANNTRIDGNFDMGSTTVGVLTIDVLKEAGDITGIISSIVDTIFSEQRMEDYKKLGEKGKKLGNKISRFASSAERSAQASIDSLVEAKDKITEIIDKIKPNLDGVFENIDSLSENFANLEKSLETVKNNIASIAEKLESGENTASLTLDKKQNGDLRREMLKISGDAERLMEKIKKNGMDLNVTILK